MNYDQKVFDAKDRVTRVIVELTAKEITPEQFRNLSIADMAKAVDDLNKAWDELTNALVRQREVRDEIISDLFAKIAELKKERG
jgi:ribosomal protein L29